MPALTKTQLDHAKQKVETARNKALAKFRESLGEKPEVPEYTMLVKRAMIIEGRATLKTDVEIDARWGVSVADAFDYPPTVVMVTAAEQKRVWNLAFAAEQDRLAAIEERLVDELVMSPDGMTALAKIAAAFGE